MLPPNPSTTRDDPTVASRRVLVLAPVEGDARAVAHVLSDAGIFPHVCQDILAVAEEITHDAYRGAGAVIVSQEAFARASPDETRQLAHALACQPPWSDLPLLLLAAPSTGEQGAWEIARALDPVGNITILERPLHRTTLLNAVAVALRARGRQYELSTTLQELAHHREHLQELVDRKTAELAASAASLRASERLASLGTLAAGLGHDIANLTLPIKMRLEVLRAQCPSARELEDLDAIGVAITHLGQLSAGMRLMGMDPDRVDVSALATDLLAWAAETVPMLRAALPRHVALHCDVPEGLGVNIPRHRLAQVVFNLVQNAGEAMVDQRHAEVRVVAEPTAALRGVPMVRIQVSDNGPGMTPEVLARCFEPYFSTKGRAIATGMGLGMVKGIVEAGKGTVAANSAPGRGTVFTLTLPAAVAADDAEVHDDSHRTGAVTVANNRIAGLACMFLEQQEMKCVRHFGSDIPSALLWVLDSPNLDRVTEFLRRDPRRRAVLLMTTGANSDHPLHRLRPETSSRIRVLPSSPLPTVLRDALVSSVPEESTR